MPFHAKTKARLRLPPGLAGVPPSRENAGASTATTRTAATGKCCGPMLPSPHASTRVARSFHLFCRVQLHSSAHPGSKDPNADEISSYRPAEEISLRMDVTELSCWQSVNLRFRAATMVRKPPETHKESGAKCPLRAASAGEHPLNIRCHAKSASWRFITQSWGCEGWDR